MHRIRPTPGVQEILFEPLGRIGWGGNGGFHALNLAVQFGARKIILLGYDMTLRNGVHWHGMHQGSLANPRQASVDRWREILDKQAPVLAARGVQVVIGSPGSALSAYRKLELRVAIDEFRGAV